MSNKIEDILNIADVRLAHTQPGDIVLIRLRPDTAESALETLADVAAKWRQEFGVEAPFLVLHHDVEVSIEHIEELMRQAMERQRV